MLLAKQSGLFPAQAFRRSALCAGGAFAQAIGFGRYPTHPRFVLQEQEKIEDERRMAMVLAEKRIVWQNDLIDMSHLNRLLYFTGGARTTTIEFLLDAEHIFKKLLDGRGAFKIDISATALEPEDCAKRLARLPPPAPDARDDPRPHVVHIAFCIVAMP